MRKKGDITVVFSYQMGEYRDDGDRLCSEVHSDSRRSNRHKMQQRKFLLHDSEKTLHHKSGQTLEPTVQRGCRFSVHKALSNPAYVDSALSKVWDQMAPRSPFQACRIL